MLTEKVTIIGAGPAGLSTALQLKRYGITPLLLERERIGGLLRNANLVENYPGFPGGIPGVELVQLFEEQANNSSITTNQEEVTEITHDGKVFQVVTHSNVYPSLVVVIASGTKPNTFTDFTIPEALLKKVYYEVYPLLNLDGRHITIVGAGDAAFDYALNLSNKNEVAILNRGKQIKCLPLLWKRADASPNITYHKKTRIIEISDVPNTGMFLKCLSPGGVIRLHTDYLIGAIGRDAQLDFLSSQMLGRFDELEKQGVLYLVGDVKNGLYRQTSIAVGEGILAAMKIYRHIQENTP